MISLTKPIDGNNLTAAVVQAMMTALSTGVNALSLNVIPPKSLRREHFSATPWRTVGSIGGWSQDYSGAHIIYKNKYPGFNTSTYGGEGAGGAGTTNWRGLETAGQVSLTAVQLGNSNSSRLRGILLCADIHMTKILPDPTGTATPYVWAGAFTFMWYDGVNWNVIAKSERCVARFLEIDTISNQQRCNVSLRYFLTEAETTTNFVSKLQVAVSVAPGTGEAGPLGPDPEIVINKYTFTAIPIQAGS